MKRCFLQLLAALALMLFGFAPAAHAKKDFIYSSAQAEKIIAARSRGVIAALRERHMNRLACFVHPQKGLRFSLYGYATTHDRKFSRAQVRSLGRNARRYYWGGHHATGDPIRLSWREYFGEYVYGRDFAAVPEINYNIASRSGNTVNNLHQFYRGSIIVEYFTPDPKVQDGHDWQSLWLIFQPRGKTWHLVGIAHDQWTI